MAKYIDKSAVVAEIERRIKERDFQMKSGCWVSSTYMYEDLLDFINTLEVKEVHDIWHDVSEKPELEQPLLIVTNGTHKDFRNRYRIGCYGKRANDIPTWVIAGCYSDSFISKWCYISDILQHTLEVKEDVVSTDTTSPNSLKISRHGNSHIEAMTEALRMEYEKGRADVLRCIDPDEMVADFCSQPLSMTRSIASIYRQGIIDILKRINNNEETSINSTRSIDDGGVY